MRMFDASVILRSPDFKIKCIGSGRTCTCSSALLNLHEYRTTDCYLRLTQLQCQAEKEVTPMLRNGYQQWMLILNLEPCILIS
mmetsp:Transcript_17814/g.42903  ORF Transcript_17814/g.42903 Transcript_17814/m.42903 type:complete len:83 (+) Transcript_17814:920-1168(+)